MHLHITNGDAAASLIKEAFKEDTIISWKDILFEGPVPTDTTFDKLSEIRAEYLSSQGYGSKEKILGDFNERNQALSKYKNYKEIILWFEHDLYDQLQLLQILDWFNQQGDRAENISIICINNHPTIEHFQGLGQLKSNDLIELFPTRIKVNKEILDLASKIFEAFKSPNPKNLINFAQNDIPHFPFLCKALRRYFMEFPSTQNGLTHTEQFILSKINQGITEPKALFKDFQVGEREYFLGMGDTSFWNCIEKLANCNNPLLNNKSQLSLTELGKQVIKNEADHLEKNKIDTWHGGIHSNGNNAWRWDGKQLILS